MRGFGLDSRKVTTSFRLLSRMSSLNPRSTLLSYTSTPLKHCDPMFYLQIKGEALWQWRVIPGGGGYSQKIWVGVCGPLPKTLTLFMTKICDFPYPIYMMTWPKTWYPIYDLTLLVGWLYLACVAGVKRGRGRQSADRGGRTWWRSSLI